MPAALTAAALVAGVAIGARVLPMLRGGQANGAASGSGLVTGVTQLTDLPGIESSPSLSPDGKNLLFVAHANGGKHIFVQRVGGENPIDLSANANAQDVEPAFSPDGERIAFSSTRDGGGLFVMGATGESPKKIVSEGAHPAWSPDGKKLVYCTEHVGNPFARNGTASLWVVDLASGEKKRIYEGDAVQPRWSPSGKRIAFWAADRGQRDVRTIPAEGGAVVPVTADVPADWAPFWAPDGRTLYFFSDRGGNRDLWRIAIDEASGKPRGAPEAVTTGVTYVLEGCISADGKRVVIETDDETHEVLRTAFDPAATRPIGGAERVYRTSKRLTQIQLSDDAQWVTARTGGAHEDIVVMRTDGTKFSRLTDDVFRDRGPVWMRGDEWICFYSNRGGEYQLWLMRADGTDARQISNSKTAVNLPAVSPDGTQLAFLSSAIGATPTEEGLVIVPVQDAWFGATAPAPFSDFKVISDRFVPTAWSPDGKSIVGYMVDAKGAGVAVYSLTTHEVFRWPDSSPYIEHEITWLPDSRHLLSWHGPKNTAVLIDAQTGVAKDIPGVTGPSGFQLSRDGRTLLMNHVIENGDLWMLTLK